MKQKLFLLMVLMVGLVACSKDEDDSDNLQIDIYKSDNLNNLGMGEFVGDWILNNKKIETDTLTVLEQTIFVKSPSESLLRYAVNTIPNVIDEMRFEVSNTIHGLYYELQGYSENRLIPIYIIWMSHSAVPLVIICMMHSAVPLI